MWNPLQAFNHAHFEQIQREMVRARAAREPHFKGARYAIRSWGLDGLVLKSTYINKHAWAPGRNEARCMPRDPYVVSQSRSAHKAPGAKCTCGLYGYHNLAWLSYIDNNPGIHGFISLLGDMEVQANTVRAEFAEILALIDYGNFGNLTEIAKRYNVPLIDRGDIIDYVNEHCLSIPPDVIPKGNGIKPVSVVQIGGGGVTGGGGGGGGAPASIVSGSPIIIKSGSTTVHLPPQASPVKVEFKRVDIPNDPPKESK